MKTKLLFLCLLLTGALMANGCAGLASSVGDNQTALSEPIMPAAPAVKPGTPETPAVTPKIPENQSGWAEQGILATGANVSNTDNLSRLNEKEVTLTIIDNHELHIGIRGKGIVDATSGTHEPGTDINIICEDGFSMHTSRPWYSPGKYAPGTKVQITATPGEQWKFDGWSGDISGNETTVFVTMDRAREVIADFSPEWTARIPPYVEPKISGAPRFFDVPIRVAYIIVREHRWAGRMSDASLIDFLRQTIGNTNVELGHHSVPVYERQFRWEGLSETITIKQWIAPENRDEIKTDDDGYRILEGIREAWFVMSNDTGEGLDGHIYITSNNKEGIAVWSGFAIKQPGSNELDKSWIEKANKFLQ